MSRKGHWLETELSRRLVRGHRRVSACALTEFLGGEIVRQLDVRSATAAGAPAPVVRLMCPITTLAATGGM